MKRPEIFPEDISPLDYPCRQCGASVGRPCVSRGKPYTQHRYTNDPAYHSPRSDRFITAHRKANVKCLDYFEAALVVKIVDRVIHVGAEWTPIIRGLKFDAANKHRGYRAAIEDAEILLHALRNDVFHTEETGGRVYTAAKGALDHKKPGCLVPVVALIREGLL